MIKKSVEPEKKGSVIIVIRFSPASCLMLMKRNVKFIMRNRAEKRRKLSEWVGGGNKGNENINQQQSMDDFMEHTHTIVNIFFREN